MKQFLVFLFVMVSFAGCVSVDPSDRGHNNHHTPYVRKSMQDYHDAGRWVSGPVDGQFIIIGVSGRSSGSSALNNEIETAKLDAARKAAMYHGVQGSVELTNTRGSGGFFDFSVDSKLELNHDTNYERYAERLSFDADKDVIRGDGATFVRFQYNVSGLDVTYNPMDKKGQPSWVNGKDLPQFAGYVTVVGFAGRRSRLRDTINASCDSAAALLIENASTQVITNESSAVNNRSSIAISTTHVRSEGRLTNFKVLEIWINPDSLAVSTLAIARVSK